MERNIQLPEAVSHIIGVLSGAGFEAYAVGGCVRDALLGREPQDWDITTSATPEQVKGLFRRTVDTGIEHGTVTIMLGKDGYEVTTYRIDGKYQDGRHPEKVTFTPSLKEDLKRRDFTINAMAYNEQTGIVDLFGGEEDLAAGVIRCVGDAKERFSEDALRILRAVRFSAQLGFVIEEETQKGIRELAGNLRLISAERIREELTKLLVSAHPERMRQAWELGITAVVLPEWDAIMELEQRNPYHCYSVGEHTIVMLQTIQADTALRYTALLHDMGKAKTRTVDEQGQDHFYGHGEVSADVAKQILRRLKFDNDTLKKVITLIQYHDYPFQMTKKSVRRALSKVGTELFPALLEVMRADTAAKAPTHQQMYFEGLDQVRDMYQEILADQECVTLKDLAVDGSDLIRAGVKPGKQMGELLHEFLELVIEDPEKNQKEYLLGILQQKEENGSLQKSNRKLK